MKIKFILNKPNIMKEKIMKLKVPKAITHGHDNLIAELKDVIDMGGRIGEKARLLGLVMAPHFKKEEEYALPPLGLLLALSEGGWEINAQEAIKMADNLQFKLEEMTIEHQNILRIMNEFKLISEEENNIAGRLFIKSLTLHIELEDQVLYPATILVGNYLKKVSKNLD